MHQRSIRVIAVIALAWLVFAPFAEAIDITTAEVQNGVAVVQGNKAAKQATIFWETGNVGQTTKGGSFGFSGVVPADCVGQLNIGTDTINVALANCAARALVPQTGQTATYAAGDDGAIRAGVALPSPRFTDNSDGSITDNLTGLIWLKKADCAYTASAGRTWQQSLDDVVSLNTTGTMNGNDCGDQSNHGTHQTDWRLPNIRELHSLIHYGFWQPALSNSAGTARAQCFPDIDCPFSFPFPIFGLTYWSSTTRFADPLRAWYLDLTEGVVAIGPHKIQPVAPGTLPVRGRSE